MHEVEVKILDINPAEIRKRLENAGAKKVFSGKITARFYDFPDRRIKKAGNLLRLRKFGSEKVELTFKKKVSKKEVKDFEETDLEVSSFGEADMLLKLLGLKQFRGYTKQRERWKKGNYQYEIDKYQGIPHFVEAEVKMKDRKAARKKIEAAVRLLGFEMKDAKPWTGADVHKHYGKRMH